MLRRASTSRLQRAGRARARPRPRRQPQSRRRHRCHLRRLSLPLLPPAARRPRPPARDAGRAPRLRLSAFPERDGASRRDLPCARREAAAKQGRFWEMHDWIYEQRAAADARSDMRDAAREPRPRHGAVRRTTSKAPRRRRGSRRTLTDGRRNGVTGTPTFFVDGERYDGAWDFHSMLEALQLPVALAAAALGARLRQPAGFRRVVLLLAAAAALVCMNTPARLALRGLHRAQPSASDRAGSLLSMSVAAWFSEGLLAIFFLLVGLEIRREMTAGELSDPRAAILPVLAALGGVLAPAAIYLEPEPRRVGARLVGPDRDRRRLHARHPRASRIAACRRACASSSPRSPSPTTSFRC